MDPYQVTATEIATLLRDIQALSGSPTASPALRATVLARKAELLARIAEQDSHDSAGQSWHGDDATDIPTDDEPYVDVRAGLVGDAIDLLELCGELVNHPGHSRIDARLRQIAGPHRYTISGIRWPHEAFAATADELQSILDTAGIIVEPTLRGRTSRHHQP
jgi:hypothetical protein